MSNPPRMTVEQAKEISRTEEVTGDLRIALIREHNAASRLADEVERLQAALSDCLTVNGQLLQPEHYASDDLVKRLQRSCGEISCDECNDDRQEALDRILTYTPISCEWKKDSTGFWRASCGDHPPVAAKTYCTYCGGFIVLSESEE